MSKKSRIQRLESFSRQRKEPKSKQVNKKTKKQVNKKTKEKTPSLIRKTYYIDPGLHNQLKFMSVKESKNVSELVGEAIKKYLKGKKV